MGARQGLITSGLNHGLHLAFNGPGDPPEKSSKNKSKKRIDSNLGALNHYYNGDGGPVELGTDTRRALLGNQNTKRVLQRLMKGEAEKLSSNFSVDLTDEVFHVGRTRVEYSTSCIVETCITRFKAFVNDGFRDPLDIGQTIEKYTGWNINIEAPGGKAYNYIPWEFSIKYKNPGYLVK